MDDRRYSVHVGRLAALLGASVVVMGLAACNRPSQSTDTAPTPGVYATSVQSLRGGGTSGGAGSATYLPCPRHGEAAFYHLCFEHQISMVISEDVGWTMTANAGRNCTLLQISDTDTYQVGGDRQLSFHISGTWNIGAFNCDLDGDVDMSARVVGRSACSEGLVWLVVYEDWSPAPITLQCRSTRAGAHDHRVPVEATIPTLEDQDFDLHFMLLPGEGTVEPRFSNMPPFSAQFLYRLKPAPEPEPPQVPLEPLTN